MPFLEGKNILVGVTGSIAAYKAVEIVSLLVKEGANVQVLMTQNATRFVQPLTFKVMSRHAVISDMWAETESWSPEHISLANWADLFLIAPATAHTIANLANGFAPEIISSTYLATRVPIVVVPAMNTKMYEHPATQKNIETLQTRGNVVLEPSVGTLACAACGKGKLPPPEKIVEHVLNILN